MLFLLFLWLFYGLDINDIQEALFQVHHIPGRWELVEAGQDFTVIVDFAHNWHGLEKSLYYSRSNSGESDYRIWLWRRKRQEQKAFHRRNGGSLQ